MEKLNLDIEQKKACFHCGELCAANEEVLFNDKVFCCNGCQRVYALLHQYNLDEYYCLNDMPGSQKKANSSEKFLFLDEESVAASLISFKNNELTKVVFYLPQIHCSSCLWLLENLKKMNNGVIFSQVNFTKKEVSIAFNHNDITLRQLADLLSNIGYEPYISMNSGNKTNVKSDKSNILKLGLVGFCFLNIMLISFPEYLGLKQTDDAVLTKFFRYMNLFLALPVFFYGASDFFITAYKGLKQKYLNIDAPIALAVLITFVRSVYEVVSNTGSGYFDSMSGIVFFMLVGRILQSKTSKSIQFNRDYQSYFPIAVSVLKNGNKVATKIQEVKKDDVLFIHHHELIPVDGILSKGAATIDYSFVTGESVATPVKIGELVYAGGKVLATNIEIIASMPFSQSGFIKLWENNAFKETKSNKAVVVDNLSKYFSIIVLLIASVAFVYWQFVDASLSWKVVSSILIIACPCVLLLSASYTNAFVLDLFSKHGMFVKNAEVLNKLTKINHIVFDKTGTITEPNHFDIVYEGTKFNKIQNALVLSVMSQSIHPLSVAIANQFKNYKSIMVSNIKTIEGKGIEAWVNDTYIKIGSASFFGLEKTENISFSEVYIGIDNVVFGKYCIKNKLKANFENLIHSLDNYNISLLSGDNDNSKNQMAEIFPKDSILLFNQSPQQKLDYIKNLQIKEKQVLMIGDGLNDAGALQQSDIGISIVENAFSFSPACDTLLNSNKLKLLNQFILASKASRKLILITFAYSILYNLLGIVFSVTANLEPMIAAIIMSASSLSIILISFVGVKLIERRYFDDKNHVLI